MPFVPTLVNAQNTLGGARELIASAIREGDYAAMAGKAAAGQALAALDQAEIAYVKVFVLTDE
jgi:hypothetical protein